MTINDKGELDMDNKVVNLKPQNSLFTQGIINKIVLVCILSFALPVHSQLSIFDLEVSKTDETCLGNGSLSFTINNGTPLANFLYTVYKLPNLTTPVSVGPINFLGSLNAGTYKIVATQTLGALANGDEEEVVIEASIVPLAYSIHVSSQNCSQGAQITLAATSGSISQSEIISGPVTRPLQSYPVFTNLPAGTYNIRVFDACGEGVVTTYTLINETSQLVISDPMYANTAGGTCDSIVVNNTIAASEGGSISYPLTIKYIIHPTNGEADLTFSQTVASGPDLALDVSQLLPLFGDMQYTYDIQVTDACNTVFTKNGIVINPNPVVNVEAALADCGQKYLNINVANFSAPLTVAFISSNGFDAVMYNTAHPGPFTQGSIQYGSSSMPVPPGTYQVVVTDACGRTGISEELIIDELLPPPVKAGRNNGCYSTLGSISVSLPARDIVSAYIVSAPSIYTIALPQDVTGSIVEGKLKVLNLPVGTYQVKVTDTCGLEYFVFVEVPPFVEKDLTILTIPYCTPGIGSVQVSSGNGKLTSMFITSAPEAFTETLPYNISANITPSGVLFMGDLPEGQYTFSGTDVCGVEKSATVLVTGYHPDAQPFTYVPNCGSFDIVMSDSDAESAETTYWMQKKHTLTGQWGHPSTGSTYEAGNVPTEGNSVPLPNNATTYNLLYQGEFRIVKSFKSYTAGVGEQYCIETWEPFTFDMDLAITNVYNLACEGSPDKVYIEAVNGLAPYNYKITLKNDVEFILDNGNNNQFTGLAPGIYRFEVTDACGSVARKFININLLPSLVTANQADDLLICTDLGTGENQVFDLSQQNAAILGDQHPDSYTVSYHLSLADADSNNNPLSASYTNISNPQTIYARVVHNSIAVCHDISSFDLHVNENPGLQTTNKYMCEGEPVWLTAENGFDSYQWATGEETQAILVDTPGTYSVTATRLVGNNSCPRVYNIVVTSSGAAEIVSIDTEDWSYDQNTITVNTSGAGNYEYSIDGVNYQDNPHFTGLIIGEYTVYARDKNGCGSTQQKVLLLNYPNFFTPNGDGTHDKWRIKYSNMEPDMDINIFDRYGKLIISLNPEGEGWDGTYNGVQLPSTDYWFVVTRSNGQVHKGHFSMLR